MTCECGCGTPCAKRFVHGHNSRTMVPNVRYAYSMPVQRVLPLVDFLFDEYGSNVRVAKAIGVGRYAIARWRDGRVRRVSPSCTRRVVEAVKAHEESLRVEATREEWRVERARLRASR